MGKRLSKEDHNSNFERVCKLIEAGSPLRSARLGIMGLDKFYSLLDGSERLRERYARACDYRAENLFEDILDIADSTGGDTVIGPDGVEKVNQEAIQRDRLRVDARKWMLSKLNPKKYGDKVDVKTDNTNLNINTEVSKTEAADILEVLKAKIL